MDASKAAIEGLPVNEIVLGEAREVLAAFPGGLIDCCVTSPPYFNLRNYHAEGQIGDELTVEEYVDNLCGVFDEVGRVLAPQGTLFVNLGDTYCPKSGLVQVPSRFSIEMANRGWILRNEIIWEKPNATPVSVSNRFTMNFEKLYFFVKQKEYYFAQQFEPLSADTIRSYQSALSRLDQELEKQGTKKYKQDSSRLVTQGSANRVWEDADALRRALANGRNKRAVWSIPTSPYKGDHCAPFPPELIRVPIEAGCPAGGIVLDPFMGSGTTALVCLDQERDFIGIEINPDSREEALQRLGLWG
jgi:DNA modification methylase